MSEKPCGAYFFAFFENFFVPILTSGGLAAVSSSAFAALYSAFGKYDVVHIHGMMVANIMKNERRWGDLEARKSIVVDYKLGKVTKNNGNRCSAYVPEHHEAIVSPEIARAAHLVASSSKKCGVQDVVVIRQGALKGFVGIHPNWSGINAESIRSLCLSTYLPEEVVELNDMREMPL